MKKLGIAGSIILDIVKRIDSFPDPGMLVNIRTSERSVGGCVCNTGMDLCRLAPEVGVSAYGCVGMDDNGDWVLARMKDAGMDVSGVRRSVSPTAYTDVMTVESTGERTFFHQRGACADFVPSDVDVNALDCDLFHLGYLLLLDGMDAPDPTYGTAAASLLHRVQEHGIKTSIDLVSEQSDRFGVIVPPAVKYCDYLIINEVEAGKLAGIDPYVAGEPSADRLKQISKVMFAFGVREKAVIHCPMLSTCMDKNGTFTVLPSLKLPSDYIVGSVGAGDAFCAGMLYGILNGLPDTECMRIASAAAACNLSCADSVSGARSIVETMQLEKQFERRTLAGIKEW